MLEPRHFTSKEKEASILQSTVIKPAFGGKDDRAWATERTAMVLFQKLDFGPLRMGMHAMGDLISDEILLLYFSTLYWIVDPQACRHGIWLIPLIEIGCQLSKWCFRAPRPGWTDSRIQIWAASHEYSFPSSHSALSWGLAIFFVLTSPMVAAYHAPVQLATTISVSRVYEGAHYPHDVMAGGILGALFAVVHVRHVLPTVLGMLRPDAADQTDEGQGIFWGGLAAGLACSAAIFATVTRAHRAVQGHTVSKAWSKNAEAAAKHQNGSSFGAGGSGTAASDAGAVLDPVSGPYNTCVGLIGIFTGLVLAFGLETHTPTSPAGTASAVARFVLGAIGLVAVFLSIKEVEKKIPEASALRFCVRILRYTCLPPYIVHGAPALFAAIGI